MNNFFGSLHCLLVRKHSWRRLRKAEVTQHGSAYQICSRCAKLKKIKRRAIKGEA